jgi:hypothetical protein
MPRRVLSLIRSPIDDILSTQDDIAKKTLPLEALLTFPLTTQSASAFRLVLHHGAN